MSALLTVCSRCGKETDERGRDGLCPFCLLDEVIQPLKSEYRRLWAKRQRYIQAGVSVRNCEAQLATVARRLGDKVHARIANPLLAHGIINGHLDATRLEVERPAGSKIHLPQTGDMLRRHLQIL